MDLQCSGPMLWELLGTGRYREGLCNVAGWGSPPVSWVLGRCWLPQPVSTPMKEAAGESAHVGSPWLK